MGYLPDNVKAKWIKNLRSGEYKQGTGVLKSPAGDGADVYCCLGVLADTIYPNGWNDPRKLLGTFYYYPHVYQEDDGNYLKTKVLPSNIQTYLATMNDTWCNTFNEIADYIEANDEI